MIKVGLDIHGTIDAFPVKFKALSNAIVAVGGEVHIVTGVAQSAEVEARLKSFGIKYTHYFSISGELDKQGKITEWVSGRPYAKDEDWDFAKVKYCDSVELDFLIDDSEVCRDTFTESTTTFLLLN